MRLRARKTQHTANLPSGLLPCLSGAGVIANGAKQLANDLRQLISATPVVYQTVYESTLFSVAALCQSMPWDKTCSPYSLLQRQMQLCIEALKLRRGMVLPKNAGAETIAEQEPQWTYAIFAAGLLHQLHCVTEDRQISLYNNKNESVGHFHLLTGNPAQFGSSYALEWQTQKITQSTSSVMGGILCRTVAPNILHWLGSNADLFALWWDAITARQQASNVIVDLLEKAAANAQYPLKLAATTVENSVQTLANSSNPPIADVLAEPAAAEEPAVDPLLLLMDYLAVQTDDVMRVKAGLLVPADNLSAFVLSYDQWENTQQFIATVKSALVEKEGGYLLRYSPKTFEDSREICGIVIKEECLNQDWKEKPLEEFQPTITL